MSVPENHQTAIGGFNDVLQNLLGTEHAPENENAARVFFNDSLFTYLRGKDNETVRRCVKLMESCMYICLSNVVSSRTNKFMIENDHQHLMSITDLQNLSLSSKPRLFLARLTGLYLMSNLCVRCSRRTRIPLFDLVFRCSRFIWPSPPWSGCVSIPPKAEDTLELYKQVEENLARGGFSWNGENFYKSPVLCSDCGVCRDCGSKLKENTPVNEFSYRIRMQICLSCKENRLTEVTPRALSFSDLRGLVRGVKKQHGRHSPV